MPKTQVVETVHANLVAAPPSYLDLVNSGSLETSEVVGGSSVDVTDKESLIGKPFVLQSIRFQEGDFGTFVIAKVLTSDNESAVFTDGSGIFRQLYGYVATKLQGQEPEAKRDYPVAIHCKGGLRRSEFMYDNETGRALKHGEEPQGKAIPATSFYIA